jgi:hypothetical protein
LDLGAQSVVLDLSAVQEADTKIVAVLMLARRRAHHLGVTLRIIVSEHVWSILELCNCAQPSWFEVHDHAEMGTVETADAGESPAACHGAWPSELFDSKAGEQTIGEAGLSEERSDAMARSTPRRRGRSLLAMLVTFGAILAGTGHRGAASDYDSACAHCDAPGEQGTFGQRMGTRN